MKILSLILGFISISFISEAQEKPSFIAPPYSGKSPLIREVSIYRKQIIKDSNQALINLEGFIPHLKLDIRYATKNNFMHARMYSLAKAYLRKPAALALRKVNQALNARGIGIIVYDAYRPYSITVKFYQKVGDSDFVASPRNGSKHNRGCALDMGLYYLKTGIPLEMPTAFDSFSKEAAADFKNLPPKALEDRTLLARYMVQNDFHTIPTEWWHFDFKDWPRYNILDISFEQLKLIP
jgi:D-alanyl-D-alanine dipeptidase